MNSKCEYCLLLKWGLWTCRNLGGFHGKGALGDDEEESLRREKINFMENYLQWWKDLREVITGFEFALIRRCLM